MSIQGFYRQSVWEPFRRTWRRLDPSNAFSSRPTLVHWACSAPGCALVTAEYSSPSSTKGDKQIVAVMYLR